jgi:CBS domain-containing protein
MADASARLAEALEAGARDWRRLFSAAGFSEHGSLAAEAFQTYSDGLAGLWDSLWRTHLRTAQRVQEEFLRIASPAARYEFQRSLAGEYFDLLMQTSAHMLRTTRRAGEQACPHRAGPVCEVMAKPACVASPDDTVQHAAQLMREQDTGVLAVGEGDRLVGIVTDRDLAERLVAEGRDAREMRVRDLMSCEPRYVYDDASQDEAAAILVEQQARRLPVVTRQKRVVGMVALADLAGRAAAE